MPVPIPPFHHTKALEAGEHPRVAHVVHGSRDGARVDGHVRPRDKKGANNNENHNAEDPHGGPRADVVDEEGLRHAVGHVAQEDG